MINQNKIEINDKLTDMEIEKIYFKLSLQNRFDQDRLCLRDECLKFKIIQLNLARPQKSMKNNHVLNASLFNKFKTKGSPSIDNDTYGNWYLNYKSECFRKYLDNYIQNNKPDDIDEDELEKQYNNIHFEMYNTKEKVETHLLYYHLYLIALQTVREFLNLPLTMIATFLKNKNFGMIDYTLNNFFNGGKEYNYHKVCLLSYTEEEIKAILINYERTITSYTGYEDYDFQKIKDSVNKFIEENGILDDLYFCYQMFKIRKFYGSKEVKKSMIFHFLNAQKVYKIAGLNNKEMFMNDKCECQKILGNFKSQATGNLSSDELDNYINLCKKAIENGSTNYLTEIDIMLEEFRKQVIDNSKNIPTRGAKLLSLMKSIVKEPMDRLKSKKKV